MKYKGAQESEAHRRLKALIERSLLADPRFQDVLAEKVWRGQRDPTSLRRPDIQARLDDLRIVSEAQLTTTFLDVVIGRKTLHTANKLDSCGQNDWAPRATWACFLAGANRSQKKSWR